MDPLEDRGYPALYEAADRASLEGQRRYLGAIRVRLTGLLAAAIGGSLLMSVGWVALGAWVALVGFLVALAASAYVSSVKPDRAWYEGRAAAESVKTLAWRYAVRGESFDRTDEGEVDREFVDWVLDLLKDLRDIDLAGASDVESEQITQKMRDIRVRDFQARKDAYNDGRIENQRHWYAGKARDNGRIGHRWGIASVVTEFLGVLFAVVVIATAWSVDLLGVFAAVATALTAWTQAKQYKTLSVAYGVASQELAGIKSELAALVDETQWAKFVGESEEAISREHTLWRASRGIKMPRRLGS